MKTLNQAIELYLTAHIGVHSEKTISRRRANLGELAGFSVRTEISDITIDDLRQFRAHLLTRPNRIHPETTLSPYTVAGFIRDVKTFFKWLQVEGVMKNNPAERLKLPRLDDMPPKAISMKDFCRMLAAVDRMGWNRPEGEILRARDRAILLFIADTGCRRMSAARLTLDQLDIDNCTAIVMVKGRLKTRSLSVFFSPPTARALQNWLDHRSKLRPRPGTDNVFVALDVPHFGQALKPNSITLLCHRLCVEAGIRKWGPHSLRHAAAREWIKNGASLDLVSRLLGHSDIQVTYLHYARWSNGELKNAHAEFGHISKVVT